MKRRNPEEKRSLMKSKIMTGLAISVDPAVYGGEAVRIMIGFSFCSRRGYLDWEFSAIRAARRPFSEGG